MDVRIDDALSAVGMALESAEDAAAAVREAGDTALARLFEREVERCRLAVDRLAEALLLAQEGPSGSRGALVVV